MSKRENSSRCGRSPRSAAARRPLHLLRNLLLFSFSVLSLPAFAARPMTIEDNLLTVRVGDPQLSPDGKWVAFVRTTTDLAAGKRNADVWLVPADGSAAPRALTRHEKTDNTPRFSPDGKTLAFLSTRSGTPTLTWLPIKIPVIEPGSIQRSACQSTLPLTA